jgi:hypothetical protein
MRREMMSENEKKMQRRRYWRFPVVCDWSSRLNIKNRSVEQFIIIFEYYNIIPGGAILCLDRARWGQERSCCMATSDVSTVEDRGVAIGVETNTLYFVYVLCSKWLCVTI